MTIYSIADTCHFRQNSLPLGDVSRFLFLNNPKELRGSVLLQFLTDHHVLSGCMLLRIWAINDAIRGCSVLAS